ncbi:MAG TPA: hypothetical protein VI357_27310 [Mycobacteriales bacterium]
MSVLTDPGWVVPPLPPGDGGGMDRLRRSVSRFATGAQHADRRAAVERALAALSPADLRASARALTLAEPGAVVPRVPLIVLAGALGVEDPVAVAALVRVVAAAYFPGSAPSAAADAAADDLLDRVGAVRAGLLVQACAPVAALVTAALERGTGLDEVLAGEPPPVPATRRFSPDTGETVTVPLTGVPFGAGPRRCPAEPHARALAEGVLDALRAGPLRTG